MVNQTIGDSFGGGMRGVSTAMSNNARMEQTYARTAQMPKQMELRELQIMSSLQMRKMQMNMQRQTQQLSLMRLQMQMKAMGMKMQEANNRIATAYGNAPTPFNMGGDQQTPMLGGPSGGNGGQGDQQDSSSADVDALFNAIVNPAVVDQIPGDNLVKTLPTSQQQKVKNLGSAQPVFTVAEQLKMIQQGRSYNMKLAGSDDVSKFAQVSPATKTALEQVIIAMPQLATSMDLINEGIQYYGNAPADLKKYFASLGSYLTGNPTAKDKEVVEKAGLSNIAMIGATEQIMRVMNLAKTNETLEKTLEMIMPAKGDTKETYQAKQKHLFQELKSRAAQAQYVITMGTPQETLATLDMANYTDAFMKNNVYKSIYEKGLPGAPLPRLHSPLPNQISFAEIESGPVNLPNQNNQESSQDNVLSSGSEEQNISKIMDAYPDLSRDDAIAIYKKYQEGDQS